jgi:succinate dehydrogenase/fumarate reductase cytochrome b subunit
MSEAVNHPQHYGGDTTYEAIKVIEAHALGFHVGNAVKYLLRAGKKDSKRELEDLKKASWYVERRIKQLEMGVDVVPVGS